MPISQQEMVLEPVFDIEGSLELGHGDVFVVFPADANREWRISSRRPRRTMLRSASRCTADDYESARFGQTEDI